MLRAGAAASAPGGIRLPQPEVEGRPSTRRGSLRRAPPGRRPGIVHGGLVAAALDEACGLLATWYRFPAVTARIFVRYRAPVAINTELLVRASWRGAGTAAARPTARSSDGDEVLAEARAAFLHVPLEHSSPPPRAGRQLTPGTLKATARKTDKRRQRSRALPPGEWVPPCSSRSSQSEFASSP